MKNVLLTLVSMIFAVALGCGGSPKPVKAVPMETPKSAADGTVKTEPAIEPQAEPEKPMTQEEARVVGTYLATEMAKDLCLKAVDAVSKHRNLETFIHDMNACVDTLQKFVKATEEFAATITDQKLKNVVAEIIKLQNKYMSFFSGLRDCYKVAKSEQELKKCVDELDQRVKND